MTTGIQLCFQFSKGSVSFDARCVTCGKREHRQYKSEFVSLRLPPRAHVHKPLAAVGVAADGDAAATDDGVAPSTALILARRCRMWLFMSAYLGGGKREASRDMYTHTHVMAGAPSFVLL